MRYLATITMLILALTLVQPVTAQSFKPDFKDGRTAHMQKDYATALRHYRPLAEQGLARAQYWLGVMYQHGMGVTQDDKEAVRWFRKSAKQGDAGGQYSIARMYRDGLGVVQDLVMSYVWYNVAAANGSYDGPTQRDEALMRLSALERRLAVKLSAQCYEKPASCPKYSFK